ncbi:MAG: mercury(II) reductase [Steroidobacteraceae bacterium]|nr:mercury(II) reductase [Deltaproteobacteria bacterium]
MNKTPDLIILGSGSTAFAAALRAASYGARVMMFEKSVMGGTCINWGCIPSKTLINAALFRHEAGLGAALGVLPDGLRGDVDFGRLSAHRERVVHKLRQERYLDVLRDVPGMELVKGAARFVDSRTVETVEERYRCEKFLIAVGGNPRIPLIQGIEGSGYLTSRSALLMKKLPASLIIIGGGVIAVEMGQMFHRLGCKVTILEHGPRLLPTIEREPAEALQQALVDEGLVIVPNAAYCTVEGRGGSCVVTADVNGVHHVYSAERLLLAVGTEPATRGIGLEKAGVAVDDKGFVSTDRFMRTAVSGIWAAGDVTGRMMIATVGAREATVAVDDMFDRGCGCSMEYLAAPMAIFTDPEIGCIGHTEESARLAGFNVVVNVMPVSAIPKAHVTGSRQGVIKMVADRFSGRILGVHLACQRGAELINEVSLALWFKATVDDLAGTMHVYPSMSEGLKLCAQGFDSDISRLSCCAEPRLPHRS